MPTGRKPYFSYSRRAPRLDSRTSSVASRAWRSSDEVQQREQQPLPDPPAAVARVDRERRDVRLVDHQPDRRRRRRSRRRSSRRGTAARRFASSSWRYAWGGHGVVNEARSMSWTAGRSATVIGRIRRHRGVGDAHRERSCRPRAPSIATPSSAGAVADAARQRDVLGDERREVVGVARRRGARPRPAAARRASPSWPRRPPRRPRPARGPSRSTATSRLAGRELRLRRRRAGSRGGSPARVSTRSDGPGGLEQDERAAAGPPRPAAPRRSRTPTIGMPQRVGQRLRGRDARPAAR